jgi:16S rRNA A1518/A1519 N6-dimethyltransferase RsmA/KsgA/DIM1 with predicted DNA glycosylase/AP lyase activity
MIKNNLQSFISSRIIRGGKGAEDLTREILENCGLRGDERAEILDIKTFGALANALENMEAVSKSGSPKGL